MSDLYDMPVELWVIHSEKYILVTDLPGPPVAACGYVSEDAAKAAKERGHATISEIGFDRNIYHKFNNWPDALRKAGELSKELGYRIVEDSYYWGGGDDEDTDWDYGDGWD